MRRQSLSQWALLLLLALPAFATADEPPAAAPELTPEQRTLMEGLIRGGKTLADELGFAKRGLKHLHGEEKKWRLFLRRYDEPNVERTFYGLGNLDSDPDSELLYQDRESSDVFVRDLDGTDWHLPIHSGPDFDLLWDYDGDGIDELILHQWHNPPDSDELDKLVAFNILGKFVGNIPGNPLGPYVVEGDFDGDGRPDLFLRGDGNYGDFINGKAFGLNAKELFRTSVDWIDATPTPVPGDVDGDGKDELLRHDKLGVKMFRIGLDEPEHMYEMGQPFRPKHCADLNGDGTDEIYDLMGRVLDPAASRYWNLEAPPTHAFWFLFNTQGFPRVATYRDATGTYLVAIVTRNIKNLAADSVAIWNHQGKLVYAMRFGVPLQAIWVGNFQGEQRILLDCTPGLLIWP